MYYKSVDDIPLKTLYKIFEKNDLKFLVKKEADYNKVKKEELKSGWDKIIEEYKELDSSNMIDRIISLSQRIEYFKTKHEMISLCTYVLRLGRNDEVETRLKNLGYKIDPENFDKSLDDIDYAAKSLQTKIGVKENDLKRISGEGKEKAKTDINKMLAAISAELHVSFKFNEITVAEFFGYKNILKDRAKQQTKKSTNVRGR